MFRMVDNKFDRFYHQVCSYLLVSNSLANPLQANHHKLLGTKLFQVKSSQVPLLLLRRCMAYQANKV